MKKTFLKQRMRLIARKIFSSFLIFFFCLSFLAPIFSNANTALAVSECMYNDDCGIGLVCDMGACVSDEPEIVLNPTLDKSCGIDMVLIIDSSSSMYGTPLQQEKDAFVSFVDSFLPNTPAQMAIVDFGTTATLLQGYTDDADDLKDAIDSVETTPNLPPNTRFTNWQDALEKAHNEFDNRSDAPDLYIFASDGNPNRYDNPGVSGSEALDQAIAEANTIKSDGVRIVTLGIGDNVDADNLKAISSDDAYYASDFNTLADDLSALADDLCGGTITVKKFLNGDPAGNWVFSTVVDGGMPTSDTATTTDDGFATFEFDIDEDIATVDLSETPQDGYILDDAFCTIGDLSVGSLNDNTIENIEISRNNNAYCEFYNIDDTSSNATVYVQKYVDDVSTAGWEMSVYATDGDVSPATSTTIADDWVSFDVAIDEATTTVQVNEVQQEGFELDEIICTKGIEGEALDGIDFACGGIYGIEVEDEDEIYCSFYNKTSNVPSSSISGYKYNDLNNNNSFLDDGGEIVSDWGIELLTCTYSPLLSGEFQFIDDVVVDPNPSGTGSCSIFASTTTDSLGYYEFTDLLSGDYLVREVQDSLWQQTFPFNNQIYYFNLEEGISTTTIDFANYQLPYCGDEVCNDDETCSTCPGDCTTGCGGGGEEEVHGCTDDNATNYNPDADVSDDSCTYCGNGTCESSYDETCSTCSSDCGSCGGGTPLCILQGTCGGGSVPETIITTGTTNEPEEVLVLGEEGAPMLTIIKEINVEQANPGDTLNYSILLTNNGNLDAFNVNLTDTLPEGLVFVEDESMIYSWSLGDIPAGESRDANYKVKVLDDTEAGTYINTAVASADNNEDVSATASVEVIVPVVLAETGIDFGELAFLFIFSMTAIVGARKLRIDSLA